MCLEGWRPAGTMVQTVNIERTRGDTVPDKITVIDFNDAVVDITGFSFLQTVSTERNPSDSANVVYSLPGTITDAPAGEVEFPLSEIQADQDPAVNLYYDIQLTDAGGGIQTLFKGKYKYKQDITK